MLAALSAANSNMYPLSQMISIVSDKYEPVLVPCRNVLKGGREVARSG